MASSNSSYLTRRMLRSILREASKNPNITSKTNSTWRSNVVEQFRKHKDEQSPEQLQTLKHIGDTYLCMMKNMREHHGLIAIHYKLADPRKSVEMASKRVGLSVPEWPEDAEERMQREREERELREEHAKFAAHVEEFKQMPLPSLDSILNESLNNKKEAKDHTQMFRAISKDDDTGGKSLSTPKHDKQEIGCQAVWSLSSAKPGFGVEQLRDDNIETYWQSDGAQPHTINIHFPKKSSIEEMSIYANYSLDESYTPSVVSIKAGTTSHDLQEIKVVPIKDPNGWINIPLVGPNNEPLRAHFLQLAILSNHQNGRDTHLRQVKVYGPRVPISSLISAPHFNTIEASAYSFIRKKCNLLLRTSDEVKEKEERRTFSVAENNRFTSQHNQFVFYFVFVFDKSTLIHFNEFTRNITKLICHMYSNLP